MRHTSASSGRLEVRDSNRHAMFEALRFRDKKKELGVWHFFDVMATGASTRKTAFNQHTTCVTCDIVISLPCDSVKITGKAQQLQICHIQAGEASKLQFSTRRNATLGSAYCTLLVGLAPASCFIIPPAKTTQSRTRSCAGPQHSRSLKQADASSSSFRPQPTDGLPHENEQPSSHTSWNWWLAMIKMRGMMISAPVEK